MRQSNYLQRFRRPEIDRSVKEGAASPLGIRRTHDIVAAVLRKPGHAAVDGMKIELPEPFFRINGKQRRFLNFKMDSVITFRHMAARMALVAHDDRKQKNRPAVRSSHLTGIEHLIRRTERKLFGSEQRIALITLQHGFIFDFLHRKSPSLVLSSSLLY